MDRTAMGRAVIRDAVLCVFMACLLATQGVCGGMEPPERQLDEYQVKAAFLYNFAKFVDWPAEAFASPREAFSICVLGEDPFGRALDDLVASKAIGGRAIAVRRIPDAGQTGGCRMLFVSSPVSKRVLSVLADVKEPGVLTVGDSGIGGAEGMVINFVMENGKVRFAVNTAAADRTGLHVSAKLLSLAQAGKR